MPSPQPEPDSPKAIQPPDTNRLIDRLLAADGTRTLASAGWPVLLKATTVRAVGRHLMVGVHYEGTDHTVPVRREGLVVSAWHYIPEVLRCAVDAVARERVGGVC